MVHRGDQEEIDKKMTKRLCYDRIQNRIKLHEGSGSQCQMLQRNQIGSKCPFDLAVRRAVVALSLQFQFSGYGGCLESIKLLSKWKVEKWKKYKLFFEELIYEVKVQGLECNMNGTLRMIYFKEWKLSQTFSQSFSFYKKSDMWLSNLKLASGNLYVLAQKDC